MLSTVPTTDTHTALCCLTPTAPRTTWRGESSPGHYSLGISVQDQLLPLSLGNLLQGLGNLGIHARRAPHDGSASAPTEPRLFTRSTHSDRHVARHTLRQAITGAPTSHRIGCDRCVAPVHQGQGPLLDHAATVTSYRAQNATSVHRKSHSKRMYHPCPPSTIKGRDRGRF